MADLALSGAELVGKRLRRAQRLSGGDLSQVMRIELEDGTLAAVKNGPDPLAEAQMLRALHAAGVPAPRVLAASETALVMSWVEGQESVSTAWAALGQVARRLHRSLSSNDRYGWDTDFAFGALPIRNSWCDDWPQFWAERRLIHFIPLLPKKLARRLEQLCQDLPNHLPAHPRPSLLHGDLWTGNVMARGNRVAALIDPACYYGDGEVDIAMLQLFGSPDAAFFAHYGELEAGAEQRLAIYRLWPALVHLKLFGDGYLRLVEQQLEMSGI